MGKKVKKKVSAVGKPFVSVCTPTYNRRMFIPAAIKCFQSQTYPKQLMEWIIIDDGTDPVGDLFEGVEYVKYFRVEEKMKIGKKRNFMHSKCKGEIIVYMDDDDYYPPERVNAAVNKLRSQPRALVAGSSRLLLYFKHIDKIYEFGPYGPNHATAGTFAFWRRLLNETSYEDEAEKAEEKHFLKNYTVPLVQIDSEKTILVFSHDHNTFDKKKLLKNPHPQLVKETSMKLSTFIKDKQLLEFYKNI
jgi:glycosyltransferase involved in cell wall biosynthesis